MKKSYQTLECTTPNTPKKLRSRNKHGCVPFINEEGEWYREGSVCGPLCHGVDFDKKYSKQPPNQWTLKTSGFLKSSLPRRVLARHPFTHQDWDPCSEGWFCLLYLPERHQQLMLLRMTQGPRDHYPWISIAPSGHAQRTAFPWPSTTYWKTTQQDQLPG